MACLKASRRREPLGIPCVFDMKDDIVAKLNRELDEEIVTERQVVYILADLSVLIEQRPVNDTPKDRRSAIDAPSR
jgi:hypothetical protein